MNFKKYGAKMKIKKFEVKVVSTLIVYVDGSVDPEIDNDFDPKVDHSTILFRRVDKAIEAWADNEKIIQDYDVLEVKNVD